MADRDPDADARRLADLAMARGDATGWFEEVYVAADLFALPQAWQQSFGLVVESLTIQALPLRRRAQACGAHQTAANRWIGFGYDR